MSSKVPIKLTQKWIEEFVLAHNLCPFAHTPFHGGQIRYSVCDARHKDRMHAEFIDEVLWLESHPNTPTTFLILEWQEFPFLDYLDLIDDAEHTLKEANLEAHYQIASFHPEYQFENAPKDDPANATNRSPFPMIHILRCADVETARQSHPNVEGIPERNIQYLRRQSKASH
ncbi:MAG: DUF1415 domain-containing protein [Myxococcota bacterium]|nr:DUF1415 domain-containing protein [Myxococcota bacterium]MEC8381742.1 DUF1415 domain-containing protein [Myxococcota bacterium]